MLCRWLRILTTKIRVKKLDNPTPYGIFRMCRGPVERPAGTGAPPVQGRPVAAGSPPGGHFSPCRDTARPVFRVTAPAPTATKPGAGGPRLAPGPRRSGRGTDPGGSRTCWFANAPRGTASPSPEGRPPLISGQCPAIYKHACSGRHSFLPPDGRRMGGRPWFVLACIKKPEIFKQA
jgi:hypothetical protein